MDVGKVPTIQVEYTGYMYNRKGSFIEFYFEVNGKEVVIVHHIQ